LKSELAQNRLPVFHFVGTVRPSSGKHDHGYCLKPGYVWRMKATDLVVTPTGLRFLNRHFPCVLGRAGVTGGKREGDGATPRGVHDLVGMLYRADRIAKPADWAVPIGPSDLWSDDPADEDYNLMVRKPYAFSHERLWRADPLYDLIVITNWNWPRAKRRHGSAIFIHQWRRPGFPTAGCIGLNRADLHWIAPRIQIGTRLIVP
jgi:L,D-peptidoglycan transpeptidase YkuD (ErfK/YbiS/YcfS/YnhG family)